MIGIQMNEDMKQLRGPQPHCKKFRDYNRFAMMMEGKVTIVEKANSVVVEMKKVELK